MSVQCFIFSDLILVLSIAFTVKMLESILNMKGVLLLDTTFTRLQSCQRMQMYVVSTLSATLFFKYMLIRSLSHEEKSSRRIINEGILLLN